MHSLEAEDLTQDPKHDLSNRASRQGRAEHGGISAFWHDIRLQVDEEHHGKDSVDGKDVVSVSDEACCRNEDDVFLKGSFVYDSVNLMATYFEIFGTKTANPSQLLYFWSMHECTLCFVQFAIHSQALVQRLLSCRLCSRVEMDDASGARAMASGHPG